MPTLEKRLEALEAHQDERDWKGCLVLLRPSENADARRQAELAAFVAQNGREPDIVSVVRLVESNHRQADGNAA